jgi:hypothetical protein
VSEFCEVVLDKGDLNSCFRRAFSPKVDRRVRIIDPGHIKAFLGEEDCVVGCAATQTDCATRLYSPAPDDVYEFLARPEVPGRDFEAIDEFVEPLHVVSHLRNARRQHPGQVSLAPRPGELDPRLTNVCAERRRSFLKPTSLEECRRHSSGCRAYARHTYALQRVVSRRQCLAPLPTS